MPRAIPESRLKDLVACASRVFIAEGYRRTQIADVAAELGVAKGTVYLYVESKEALFAAALRWADEQVPGASDLDLPLPTPAPGELERELAGRLAAVAIPSSLARAAETARVPDARAELERIVRDLYALSSRHRTAIKLLDRCSRDHPVLSSRYYGGGRFAQLDLLVRVLGARIEAGLLPPLDDVAVAARFVIESIATWAVHIHWDPSPQEIDPVVAERTVVALVVRALAGDPS
jgi:AcrR family transcriptional regulator